MQQANLYSLALSALVLALAISSEAAGIKGHPIQQQQEAQQQRAENIKGPRQLQPVKTIQAPQQLVAAPVPVRIVPVQQPAAPVRPGAGQFSPVFSSKRPLQQTPLAPAPQQPVIIQQQQQIEPEIQQQQQQQVESSEIDPNAAAGESGPSVLAPAVAAPAASEEEANPKPEPYAFNYAFDAADSVSSGSSAREEQQDASGRVTGFYTLKGQDGRDRRVDYIADASGFRASISTNELGTAPKDPADAHFQASSPSDAQLRAAESATQAARQRALLAANNPLQQQEQIPAGSSGSSSKLSLPRSKNNQQAQPTSQIRQEADSIEQAAIVQLQEPFEQIRQTELKSRARKSRHAPFYLFTI